MAAGKNMSRPRAADDFAAIRARMEELRQGRNMTRPRAADDFSAIRARMEELRRKRSPVPSAADPRRVGRSPGSLPGDTGARRDQNAGTGCTGDWSRGLLRR